MSHASHQELEEIVKNVRFINKSLTCAIGIMVDTQGPEIRTAKNSEVLELVKGEQIILSSKKTLKKPNRNQSPLKRFNPNQLKIKIYLN